MKTLLTSLAASAALACSFNAQAADDVAADVAALKAIAAETTLVKDGDAAAGQAGYAMCVTCHLATGAGNPPLQAPRITGLPAWYVAESVKKFKASHRGGSPGDAFGMQMRMMATAAPGVATEKGLADVAAHIASLEHKADAPTVQGDVAKGKAIYEASCVACHGADGAGNVELLAPPVNVQPDWYVVNQLTKFRNGQRGAHADDKTGAVMTKHAKELADDAAIKDVAAYLQTIGKK